MGNMRLKFKVSLVLLAAAFTLFPARAYAATVDDIAKEFICQCGCNSVLNNCTHAECGSREAMTTFISQKMSEGMSGDQITRLFVAQYGEQVLSSPPKRGFNLLAWITPFAAILLGAGVISLALREWVRRGRRSRETVEVAEKDEEEKEYWQRLERELSEFNERSFR